MPSPSSELKLDPGPQPRRRPRQTCSRCVLWTSLALVGLAASYGAYVVLRYAVRFVNTPHFLQLHDLSVPYKPNEVLKPLVSREQTFDVVATVWVHRDGGSDAGDASALKTGRQELAEDVVYSDTVFRGLRLKDKNVKTAVNLSVPTEVFKRAELWSYDLRASFVLVPNPPSPLDFAVNYSSWIPNSIYYPPMRPASEAGRTLADEIVDSFGVFVPLLEFHPIASACEQSEEAEATEDEDDDNWDMPAATPPLKVQAGLPQAHPYVATRTHIRVLDVTALYNRARYDVEHRSLASKSCGQGADSNQTSWEKCWKTLLLNGNMETRIKLRTRNPSTGANMTEWAYAPYITYSDIASGPLDLVPVPVSREKCLAATESTGKDQGDSSRMNITWNIAISGRTPPKWMGGAVAQVLVPVPRNMSNMTEVDLHSNQAVYAFINGIVGHSYEGKGHPRILFLTYLTLKILTLPNEIIDSYYWFSRSSTAGVSIIGTGLRALGILINNVMTVMYPPQDQDQKPYSWTGAIFYLLIFSVAPMYMLKTLTRVEVRWSSTSWVPKIYVAGATHAERASQRVDARTPTRYILTAYAAIAALFFVCYKFDIHVVSTEGIRRPPTKNQEIFYSTAALLFHPCAVLGRALQIVINFRHRTFAGAYKISASISFIAAVSRVVINYPGFFGFSSMRMFLKVPLVVNLILLGILAWQSVVYPSASQVLKEDNIE